MMILSNILRKLIISSAILFMVNTSVAFPQSWISLDGSSQKESMTIDILESTRKSFKAKITIHGLYDLPVVYHDTLYHQVIIPELFTGGNLGTPQLPIVSQMLVVPTESYIVTVEEIMWSDTSIGDIYPVQPDLFEGEAPSSFFKNSEIYSSTSYEPTRIQVGQKSLFNGINNITIKVCPFKYRPTTGTLSILNQFIVNVEFTGLPRNIESRYITDKEKARFKTIFSNSNIVCDTFSTNINERETSFDEDYLIIVGNIAGIMNCSSMNEFLRWKAFKGFKTKVVTTAQTGLTADSIKSFISTERSNHPNLSYVLFIGENELIPMKRVPSPLLSVAFVYSDRWYGCLNDQYPDSANIAIGRFSISNLEEFTNIVEKTIKYEKEPPLYTADALLIAHKEGAPNKYQSCMDYIRNSNYTETPSFCIAYGARQDLGGNNASNQIVLNHINEGINIVNYRGHGNENNWSLWNVALENFVDTLINNMNSNVCSVFLSIACSTGNIRAQSCMLETFTRSDHGAVAFLGANKASETTANHYFNKKIFDYIYNRGCYHIGDVNNLAHYDVICNIDSAQQKNARYNSLIYLWGGDPSLELWTNTPQKIQGVELHEDNTIRIQIPNLSNYTVSVVTESNELIDIRSTSNGICTLPSIPTNVYYVINCHNYIPYIIKYDVTTNNIQNETLEYDAYYYRGTPLAIGYDVDPSQTYGNVNVKGKCHLNLNLGQGVTIKNGFSMEKGSVLSIE